MIVIITTTTLRNGNGKKDEIIDLRCTSLNVMLKVTVIRTIQILVNVWDLTLIAKNKQLCIERNSSSNGDCANYINFFPPSKKKNISLEPIINHRVMRVASFNHPSVYPTIINQSAAGVAKTCPGTTTRNNATNT